WLYQPFPVPDFSLSDLGGRPRTLSALRGRPAVLLLWSAASEPSRAALHALGRGRAALTPSGVGALAVALDPPAELARVREAASAPGLPVVVASEEVGIGLALLYRHLFMNRQALPLPTALLLDADGSVVKVYRGRIDAAEIARDAARIEAPPPERLARAMPFAGTLYAPPNARNYLPFGQELLDQGLEAQAVVAFRRAAQGNPTASTLYRLGTLLVKTGQAAEAK